MMGSKLVFSSRSEHGNVVYPELGNDVMAETTKVPRIYLSRIRERLQLGRWPHNPPPLQARV